MRKSIKKGHCYIWDLSPQNEKQVAKFHFQVITRFMLTQTLTLKWYIICQGCCLFWVQKPIISLTDSFVFYWFLKCSMSHVSFSSLKFLKCSMSHVSFSSLATCRSVCENMSHLSTEHQVCDAQHWVCVSNVCTLTHLFLRNLARFVVQHLDVCTHPSPDKNTHIKGFSNNGIFFSQEKEKHGAAGAQKKVIKTRI